MAEQFVQREGVALVEMTLRRSNAEPISFLGTDVVFVGAEITEVSSGFSSASFVVQSSTRDYVDKLLKDTMADFTPRLRWRVGIGAPAGVVSWLPWQEHIIRSYGALLEGSGEQSGYLTRLSTSDLLWEINRVDRVGAHNGKISAIIQEIADTYKLPSVIEPTKTTGSFVQNYLSDYEFITQRMVQRALNDKGRGNYKFYLRDGTLHFHTIDYQASLKDFSYYDSPGTRLVHLDKTQETVEIGVAGVHSVIVDPYSGAVTAFESNPDDTLRLANTAPDVRKVEGARLNLGASVGPNRVQDAESIAANAYESIKQEAFCLQLTIPKTIFFRANDLVRVTIQPKNAETPPWNGLYYVGSVTNIVDKNSIISKIEFYRGEFASSGKTFTPLTNLGEPVVNSPRGAAGQDPNLKAVAASVLTKGSGNAVSRNLVLDTQNPNTALKGN